MSRPGATWFKEFGRCCTCKKRADGELFNSYNACMGAYCRKCANAAIKKAQSSPPEKRISIFDIPLKKE